MAPPLEVVHVMPALQLYGSTTVVMTTYTVYTENAGKV